MIPLVSPSNFGYAAFDPKLFPDYPRRLAYFDDLHERFPLVAGYRISIDCPSRFSSTGRSLHPSLARGGRLNLDLVRPLVPPTKTRSNMSSAVWLAQASSLDTQDALPPPLVVVKFIQPSQLPYSKSSNPKHWGWDRVTWQRLHSPDWLARNESAGYDRLSDLQGTVIPYFFGKHIVGHEVKFPDFY